MGSRRLRVREAGCARGVGRVACVTGFATAVDRLINQVAHWEQARWWTRAGRSSGPGPPPASRPSDSGPVAGPSDSGPGAGTAVPPTRADLVYALVQRIADRGADAEGRPRRTVPRLADLVLPDQVRVVADDLIAATPAEDVLVAATADVDAVRRAI